jgi:hypothetical protein
LCFPLSGAGQGALLKYTPNIRALLQIVNSYFHNSLGARGRIFSIRLFFAWLEKEEEDKKTIYISPESPLRPLFACNLFTHQSSKGGAGGKADIKGPEIGYSL